MCSQSVVSGTALQLAQPVITLENNVCVITPCPAQTGHSVGTAPGNQPEVLQHGAGAATPPPPPHFRSASTECSASRDTGRGHVATQ